MSFVLPDGYIGAVPDSDPSMFKNGLYPRRVPPPIPQLEAWLTDRGVSAIVVMDEVRSWFEPTLREMGYAPVQAGDGVSVWRAA